MLVTAVICNYLSKWMLSSPLKAAFAFHCCPQPLSRMEAAASCSLTVPGWHGAPRAARCLTGHPRAERQGDKVQPSFQISSLSFSSLWQEWSLARSNTHSSCNTYSWQWSCSFQFDRLLPAHHLVINICSIRLYSWLNKFSYEIMQLILKGTLILTLYFPL